MTNLPNKTLNKTLIGFDPSMRHWGIAKARLDHGVLTVLDLQVIQVQALKTIKPSQSIQDFQLSKDLFSQVKSYLCSAGSLEDIIVFAEAPIGSQSSRAQTSYAMCLSLLGVLAVEGYTVCLVTPYKVKSIVGDYNTSKEAMIDWAYSTHPEAPWPKHKVGQQFQLTTTKANHMADALAVIYAGLSSTTLNNF